MRSLPLIFKLCICAAFAGMLCIAMGCAAHPEETSGDDFSAPPSDVSVSAQIDKADDRSEFSQFGSMPRTGAARVLALRVTFPEYDGDENSGFAEGDDLASLAALVDGSSISADGYPYDSLSAFYLRASYGKLEISGDAFDYRADDMRDVCATHKEEMVLAALEKLDGQGVDLSSYDGDGDGVIDCLYIHAAGPLPSWGDAWWSFADYYHGDETVAGVTVGSYITLHRPSNAVGAARNMIHETGHALGLPDLYGNYEADQVSDTGELLDSKSFGMMDSSTGDIDLYFKWYLGWLDDSQVVFIEPGDEAEVELAASGMPAGDGKRLAIIGASGKFGKMYAVEYDRFLGNFNVMVGDGNSSSPLPDGFRIFAVDSSMENGSVIKDNASQDASAKLFEAVDVDAGHMHAVYHGVPYAVGAPYNCPLLEDQSIELEGERIGMSADIMVSALSCGDKAGRLLISSRQ